MFIDWNAEGNTSCSASRLKPVNLHAYWAQEAFIRWAVFFTREPFRPGNGINKKAFFLDL